MLADNSSRLLLQLAAAETGRKITRNQSQHASTILRQVADAALAGALPQLLGRGLDPTGLRLQLVAPATLARPLASGECAALHLSNSAPQGPCGWTRRRLINRRPARKKPLTAVRRRPAWTLAGRQSHATNVASGARQNQPAGTPGEELYLEEFPGDSPSALAPTAAGGPVAVGRCPRR